MIKEQVCEHKGFAERRKKLCFHNFVAERDHHTAVVSQWFASVCHTRHFSQQRRDIHRAGLGEAALAKVS